MEAIWDRLLEHAIEEARSKGVSEAQLMAFGNDSEMHQLGDKFTRGILTLAIAKFHVG